MDDGDWGFGMDGDFMLEGINSCDKSNTEHKDLGDILDTEGKISDGLASEISESCRMGDLPQHSDTDDGDTMH